MGSYRVYAFSSVQCCNLYFKFSGGDHLLFVKSNLQLSLSKWCWLSRLSQGWKHLFYLLLSRIGGTHRAELRSPRHGLQLNSIILLCSLPVSHQILQKVLQGCRESMLGTMALAACQFMEEPGMEVQVRESKHPYNNNTNFEV